MNTKNKELCNAANGLKLNILTFGHARITTGWRGTSVSRSYSFLYFVYRGGCVIKGEMGEVRLSENNWYLIPSGCNFEYYCEDKMEHIYFHIELVGADRLDAFRHIKEPISYSADEIPEELFDIVQGKKDLASIIAVRMRIYKALHKILTENNISLEAPPLSECVNLAIKYIQSNRTAALTTSEIAASAFVSKSKLTKQFRRELSMSVQEYLYNILLSEATRLLINTELAVSEISERLGFSDQFYFSRKFKQKYGLSPRAYKTRAELI